MNNNFSRHNLSSEIKGISAEQLLERIPLISVPGEESAANLILFKIIEYLSEKTNADIGQINLLHMNSKLEKICIVKDGQLWLKRSDRVDGLDPHLGFTGVVLSTGKSLLVRDIWDENGVISPNPFLKLIPQIKNKDYINEIKQPIASTIILPVKRGQEVFCTIELSRYRNREPFTEGDKTALDYFTKKYGSLIIDYLLDIKNRDSVNTAYRRLLDMSRYIASGRPVNYVELIEPYSKMSIADFGIVFFRTGGMNESSYRMVAWHEDYVEEIVLNNFIPSTDSILKENEHVILPVEGEEGDDRLIKFTEKIKQFPELNNDKRAHLLKLMEKVKSYVIYPLHMLNQELGAVIRGAAKASSWKYLHMNPFLSLYNSLMKSFLLNERLIHYLSDISLKVHNPGFYSLGAIKTALFTSNPNVFSENETLCHAFESLDELLSDLHDQGRKLKWCPKKINLSRWLRAFIQNKKEQFPVLKINYNLEDEIKTSLNIMASDEQLDTIFENLFTNSIRAIMARKSKNISLTGEINVVISEINGSIEIIFFDNGLKYKTVSGRGVSQIREEMKSLSGSILVEEDPYKTYLQFPILSDT